MASTTAREILLKNAEDNKFIDDTINSALNAATDRINGNSNNEEYRRKIEELKKNVEAKKQQEKRLAILKASQEVQTNATSGISQGVSKTI